MKIGFIGLGVMGTPMAAHLARAGHSLTLYNRTQDRAEAWVEKYAGEGLTADIVNSPAAAARGADAIITCVGNDDDVAEVTMSPQGVFSVMRPGSIFIDHTTVSARISRQVSVEGKAKEIFCVDAPVSGGHSGAEKGTLSIMCGATPRAMDAAMPLLKPYAKRIVHVGKPGAGQTAKMANQICIAGTLAGLSEAIRFSQASRLDTDKIFEAISGGSAQSWQMDNRWQSMNTDDFDFGFAIDWMRKDLGLALEEARNNGASLPVAAMVDQFYAQIQAMGYGKDDTSALIRHLIKRPGRG